MFANWFNRTIMQGANLGAVATPVFSPAGGTYGAGQDVVITSPTAGAALFYSLISALGPWTPYTGPVDVDVSDTLYAYGSKAGYSNSAVGSAAYVISAGPPLTDMVAWFRKGVGQSDAGGGACSAWADQSGLGHHLAQATGLKQPAIQGDGTLLFDGLLSQMVASAFTLNQPVTWYARLKLPNNPGAGNRYLFDGNVVNTGVTFFLTNRTPNTYAGAFGPVGPALTLNTWASLCTVQDGASSVVQVDATSSSTGNMGAANPGGLYLCSPVSDLPGEQVNAYIAEVIVYAAAHDATQRGVVIAYLDTVI